MADEELQTIATNLVIDPRLTHVLPEAQNATQTVRSSGMGLTLSLTDTDRDGWVCPWNTTPMPEGNSVGVLLIQSPDGLTPYNGVSMDNGTMVWLRGGTTEYAHAMAVRSTDLSNVRLHLPVGGKPLVLLKVGLFDAESWANMQNRNIIYFDGGGITQAGVDGYTLPPATTRTLGGVIVGDGLQVDDTGLLSVLKQEIPVATVDTVGGIKPGKGLVTAADGTTQVSINQSSHIRFNSAGELETYNLDFNYSDYYTRDQVDAKLLNYYPKSEADLKFALKGESGGGSGGDNTGGNAGLSANYQFAQLRFVLESAPDEDITSNGQAPTLVPFSHKMDVISVGPGSFISAGDNGLQVSRAGYYRLSARIHYNIDRQGAEAGAVIVPSVSNMNKQLAGQLAISYHGITRRDGQWPQGFDRCDIVGVLPSMVLDLSSGALIQFRIFFNGQSSHKGHLTPPSFVNLEWVGEKTTSSSSDTNV